MMKNLKLWQKAGLATLVALPLALGLGFNFNKNSKGVESKIPSIGMSVAQAMIPNPDGYEIPDLTGKTPKVTKYKETDKGFTYKVEVFLNVDGQNVIRLSRDGKIFGYVIDEDKDNQGDYTLLNNDGDETFESKYPRGERFNFPDWAFKS